MDTTFIILVILVIITSISFRVLYSGKNTKIKQELKKTPFKPLSEFKNGDISKVDGTLEYHDNILKAPLSGRDCAYFQVLVQRRNPGGKLVTLIELEHAVDFVLDQKGNKVLVIAKNYKGYLVKDRKYKSGFLNDATGNLERYLRKFGETSINTLGLNKTMIYQEGILEAGAKAAVKGAGYWESEEKKLINPTTEDYLVIKGIETELIISDDFETAS